MSSNPELRPSRLWRARQARARRQRNGEYLLPVNILMIGGMHVLAAYAVAYASTGNVLALAIAHVLVNNVGMVLGLHRYLSHRQFRTGPYIENLLALLGTLNLQGGPIRWAATHRAHHRHTDDHGDPHAAHRGFYWSHVGWMLVRTPNGFHFTRSRRHTTDLQRRPGLQFMERHYLAINLLAALGFIAATRDAGLFLWAFPLRIVLGWHLTWLVNSYSHRAPLVSAATGSVGYRNSALMSLLVLGEGWHGNHHRHPASPTTSLHRWQLDPGFWVLAVMEKCGLVSMRAHRPLPEHHA